MVERSNLAALEFLMSKQPRGSVRMSAGNAGACVSNIFVDVKKFQTRFHDAMDKASTHGSKVCTSLTDTMAYFFEVGNNKNRFCFEIMNGGS